MQREKERNVKFNYLINLKKLFRRGLRKRSDPISKQREEEENDAANVRREKSVSVGSKMLIVVAVVVAFVLFGRNVGLKEKDGG